MERLTYWNKEYSCWSYHGPSGNAAIRLAAYENTGLEPEEIKAIIDGATKEFSEYDELMPKHRIKELAQAEKDGRLVVLPCKPGTELFTHCHVRGANPIAHSYFYPPYIPTLGENAWLTREEAEAALKKREAADNEHEH